MFKEIVESENWIKTINLMALISCQIDEISEELHSTNKTLKEINESLVAITKWKAGLLVGTLNLHKK